MTVSAIPRCVVDSGVTKRDTSTQSVEPVVLETCFID